MTRTFAPKLTAIEILAAAAAHDAAVRAYDATHRLELARYIAQQDRKHHAAMLRGSKPQVFQMEQ